MDIKINLPKPDNTCGNRIKLFLRQMELCVHHLQKSIEELEKEGELTENTFIIYRFPSIDLYKREQDKEGNVKVHVDEESDQMQDIIVEISNV